MIIRAGRFNIYLFAVLTAVLLSGCHSADSKKKKYLSTLRIHAEMNPDPMGKTERIQVFRAQPYWLTVNKEPFITEVYVKEARVVDVLGGFAVHIQLDQRGSWLLEQYTASMRGKHLAIFSQFVNPGEEKLNQGRWLSAPLIKTHITDGLLVFTPDATRQEAEQLTLGLGNVAKKLGTGK
jgi:preprotein translocase subunit SecD